MPYVRYRRRRAAKKPLRKTRKGVRRVYKRTGGTIARQVKKVISRMAEIKSVNTDPTTYGFNANNGTCSPAVDMTTALEQIATGNTDGSRVGNRVMLKRYDVRMNFYMNPTFISGATFRGGKVMVYFGTLKSDRNATPNSTDLGRLKNDGSGSASLDNTWLSTLRDDNKDYFNIVAKREFKLGGAGSPYPNNDFPIQKTLIFKNLLKGQVVWNDGLLAVNKALFMWCHFVTVDSVLLTVTVPVLCDYYISCKYIDM